MTYGRLPLEEWEKRKGNPYLLENGRWYRITDHHVVVGLKQVNYQAEECDPREVERYLAEHWTPPEPNDAKLLPPSGDSWTEYVQRQEAEQQGQAFRAEVEQVACEQGIALDAKVEDDGAVTVQLIGSPDPVATGVSLNLQVTEASPMVEEMLSKLRDSDPSETTPWVEAEPEEEPERKPYPWKEGFSPTLADYARYRGWVGNGRIANVIKDDYRREFGAR